MILTNTGYIEIKTKKNADRKEIILKKASSIITILQKSEYIANNNNEVGMFLKLSSKRCLEDGGTSD